MKSLSKTAIFLVLISFVATSCGKYEEGPKISLMPRNARMINTWKLDKQYENGVEQTLTADEKDDYYNVKKDGVLEAVYVTSGSTTTFTGTWEFTASDANVRLAYTGSYFGFPFTFDEEYTILRLTSNELWLEQVNGSTTDELHFVTK